MAVERSRDFQFAISDTKASSKKNCAGQMLRIKGLKSFRESAMTSFVQAFGGLGLGSLVLLRARKMVMKIFCHVFSLLKHIFIFADDKHKPLRKRTILCVDQNEYALPPEQCEDQPRPSDKEPCSLILPPCSIDDNTLNNSDFSDNEIPDTI